MSRSLLLFLLSIFASNLAKPQNTNAEILQAGVSQKLAQQRKSSISQLHYSIKMVVPVKKESSIAASEVIQFLYKKNGQPLLLDFTTSGLVNSIRTNSKATSIFLNNEHLIIPDSLLRTGLNTIEIAFIAGDLSLNRNDDYLYTLLVPDRARTVFPCFDQPDLKATFKLSLTLPPTWTAISNGSVATVYHTADSKTYDFKTSDKISTYLFSFAAGVFNQVSRTINGRTMHFLHRETDSSKIKLSLNAIFNLHNKALQFLQRYTKQPFPFQKLDFVAIPDFQYGGMEHVGAIQYKAASLFLDSGATKDQLNARANLIAHETAHMWFGDLVTMQWFNDVWTKEVFANFMADKINRDNNNNSYDLKFLLDHYPSAYAVDRTAGANAIRQPLANLQEAGNLYGNIIYHKAPIMMRQLELVMGEIPFRNGLREYLATYRFSNATWPNLIAILDRYTKVDLLQWNRTWVSEPGRPVFTYKIKSDLNKITSLTLQQHAENGSTNLLPQTFNIALVYKDTVVQIPVLVNGATLQVAAATQQRVPECIVFNSNGIGYGLFPVDSSMIGINRLPPLTRASAYINLYENMLAGHIAPQTLLHIAGETLGSEQQELIVNLLTGYITDIFWRLTLPPQREVLAAGLQKKLWPTMLAAPLANIKKILFKTYQSIATTDSAKKQLYNIWLHKAAPPGVTLTEDDYTALALNLAVKDCADTTILKTEYDRIKNVDRKKRLQFLIPAVSGDLAVRDSFFSSLQLPKNREKESWVSAALTYLHHPLRTNTSIKYLRKSLELLPEIQATGDIFFPAAWLNATFYAYTSPPAAQMVRQFLADNPNFNAQLKLKVLQSTDPLLRAEKLLYP